MLLAEAASEEVMRRRMIARMDSALQDASSIIHARGLADRSLRGMATTSVVVQIVNTWVLIGHVGDSRVYLIRGGRAYQLTGDHSLGRMLFARGAITAEEADNLPNNVIVRALGLQPAVEVDFINFELLPGDVLLMCTDGLSDPVTVPEMLDILARSSPAAAAAALVERANHNGGPDNITAGLIYVSGEAPAPAIGMELQVELLQHVTLFRDLTFQEAARMLGFVVEQRLDAGHVVFGEGDHGTWFYIVAEGAVDVSQRGVHLTTIQRGGHFGELGLITDAIRSATVRTREPTVLLAISAESILWLVRHDHALAIKLLWGMLGSMADRIKALSTQLTWTG
jgi:serine/threonine protein phosphatase PrpC